MAPVSVENGKTMGLHASSFLKFDSLVLDGQKDVQNLSFEVHNYTKCGHEFQLKIPK